MTYPTSLSQTLRDCADSAPEWQSMYDDFVARVGAAGAGSNAPQIGSPFPPLMLPDTRGRYRALSDANTTGLLVVSFNRGEWCPYCRHELESWRDAMPALQAAGATMAVIAGVAGGRAEALSALLDQQAAVFCDVDHGAALALGLAYYAGSDIIERYLHCGLDLADIYGSAGGFLPIPATFVVDRHSVVRYAFVDPDFRKRAEPDVVIEAVRRLTPEG